MKRIIVLLAVAISLNAYAGEKNDKADKADRIVRVDTPVDNDTVHFDESFINAGTDAEKPKLMYGTELFKVGQKIVITQKFAPEGGKQVSKKVAAEYTSQLCKAAYYVIPRTDGIDVLKYVPEKKKWNLCHKKFFPDYLDAPVYVFKYK